MIPSPHLIRLYALFLVLLSSSVSYVPHLSTHARRTRAFHHISNPSSCLLALRTPEEPPPVQPTTPEDDDVTSKGLEFALFKSATNSDASGPTPQELLKKYGAAYLMTSIPLAAVSFGLCYFLVSTGVDVTSLISKIPGLSVNDATTQTGNVAIAYAAHKALSPGENKR